MNLNVQDWKEFKLSDIFEMQNGYFNNKPETIDSLPSDHPVKFLGATAENNGITDYCGIEAIRYSSKTGDSDNSLDGKLFDGNCISITNNGSVCHAYYQNVQFTSSHDQTICVPRFNLTPAMALFICTIINRERFKWSYGRKLHDLNKSKAIIIKLPIQHNPDGTPVIDAEKTYSDEGYVPDWQFMEDYIKSLHSEPITTTRGAAGSPSLGVDRWEEFKLSDIFEMQNGYFNNKPETIDSLPSDHPVKFLGATAENNGITDYCGIEAIRYSSKTGDSDNSLDGKIYEGNCITITNDGSVCHAYYQDTPFTSSHSQTICVPKFELNPALALFICAIIDGEQFKWSYGRKLHDLNKSKAIVIKLPIQRDAFGNPVIDPDKKYSDKGYIPDWDFMERYIDSLPYSDRIA